MASKIKILSLLILSVLVVFVLVFKFVVEPYEKRITSQKMIDTCNWHMRAICTGFFRHAIVNKLDSPQILKWCDEQQSFVNRPPICPSDYSQKDIKCSYAINKNIEKYTFENLPDDIVLFFESDLGWNGVGDSNDVNYGNHEGFSAGIIFADGHISHLKREVVNKLRWE